MSSRARSTSSSFVPGVFAGSPIERRAVRRRVVAEARASGDLAPLVVDAGELLEADLVDLLGVHLERRPAADRGAVDRVAVGRRPDAGLLAAGVAVLALQRLEERGIGRVDDVADDVADPLAIRLRARLDAARDDRARRSGSTSMRSSWAIVRSVTIDGAVRPLTERLAQDVGVGGHERRVGVEPLDECAPAARACRPAGTRSAAGAAVCGPPIWSTTRELVEALVVLLDARARR